MIDLLEECQAAIRPKKRLDPVAWMEANYKLTEGPMADAPFRFRNNPVLLVAFQLYAMRYREIVFIAGTQVGKTIFLLGSAAYEICERPGSRLLVVPDENVAKRFFKNKITPMLDAVPAIAAERTGRKHDETYINIRFRRCVWNIGWAGSPASLASDSKQYVDFDETAKMKIRDREEGDPVSLASERIKSFGSRGRKKVVTTPTREDRPGWKNLAASTWHECYLPCPHCSKRPRGLPRVVVDCEQPKIAKRMAKAGYFVPDFKRDFHFSQTTEEGEVESVPFDKDFPASVEPGEVERNTTLTCPNCDGVIEEKHKRQMIADLIAIPRHPGRDIAGVHAPSWLSLWVSWGAFARKYVEAIRDPEPGALKNFRNGWEGLPDAKEKVEKIKAAAILAHKPKHHPYGRHQLPWRPDAIFMTVDLRAPEAHYVIRAWRWDMTSALLSYGEVARLNLENGQDGTSIRLLNPEVLRTYEWRNEDGSVDEYMLDAVLIDANYDETEVHAWCITQPLAYPVKGSSKLQSAFRQAALPSGLRQFTLRSNNFRTRLARRLDVPLDSAGAWWLPSRAGKDYAHHFTFDHQVEKVVNGEMTTVWVQDENAMNHYYDCEVYQLAAAAIFRIQDLAPSPSPPSTPSDQGGNRSDFVTAGGRIGNSWGDRR